MTYSEYKLELEQKLGPAEFDYDRSPKNECARLLMAFKGKQMADARANKRRNEAVEALIVEPKELKAKLDNLSGLVPLESDLEAFQGIAKDVLRVYLVNQDIEPKKLANSFGKSYQYIAGLLNSKAVQILRAKYFHKQLDNNTKIGLLKLTEEADPKITLAAAEYLRILHDKEADDSGSTKLIDPVSEKALQRLADWIADGMNEDLVIKAEGMKNKGSLDSL